MKIVQFWDGTYGIERGFLRKEFFSYNLSFWTGDPVQVNGCCKFKNKEEAINAYHVARLTRIEA